MAENHPPAWQPKKIRRVELALPSGSEVVRTVTDVGDAFVKFLGNREGPHILACELIGTALAEKLGMQVFDYCIFRYDGIPRIQLGHSRKLAETGNVWATRREEGTRWSGDAEHLALLANPADLAKLVLIDQWTRNCDRYRPPPKHRVSYDNVFLSRAAVESGKFRLVAMDFSHAFTCGSPLTSSLTDIDHVQDETNYGMFPAFEGFIQREQALIAVEHMAKISDDDITQIVTSVPSNWGLNGTVRTSMIEFLVRRRDYLKTTFVPRLFPQDELFNIEG